MTSSNGSLVNRSGSEDGDVWEYNWCFDMDQYIMYLASRNFSDHMRKKYDGYKRFSFQYNGLVTFICIIFGCVGTTLLIKQIHGSRVFSRRLAVHLSMICVWDSLYLISCLVTYCIPSICYSVTPVYGLIAYVLFAVQPFASFCVSCTIWQIFAITLERYWAVSAPLEQRTRKAKFAVGWICIAIIFGAFILNLLPVPFESELVPCIEGPLTRNGPNRIHTLLKPYMGDDSRMYRFIVHFFPDLIFRAPLPIIIIGILTVKTIQVCNQRNVGVGHINIQMKRNIPLRLSLLNFKFVLCNTLYMFNTILLELLGYGVANVESSEDGDRYINSFYLTDASNMLLVVHSATNWLLFYRWPKCATSNNTTAFMSTSLTSSLKSLSIRSRVSDFIAKRVSNCKNLLGTDIVARLCFEMPDIYRMLLSDEPSKHSTHESLMIDPQVQEIGEKVGAFVEQVFKWFADRRCSGENMRQLGRRLGHFHFEKNIHFTPHQWKLIRSLVTSTILRHVIRDQSSKDTPSSMELTECITRVFNYVLSEMRNGVLCAAVEANNSRGYRSNSACLATAYADVPRKSKSVSSGRIRHHNSTDSACKMDSGSRVDLLSVHPATAPANILGSPRFL